MSPAPSITKSTGPRTPEGKIRSSLNALRQGLTGRVVVLPHEDLNAYQAFCKELFADLAPETALERQYAQTFCDTQWRLNRARSIEDSMFALGHSEPAGDVDPGHPEVHAALTAAGVFRENSKAFVNLSLYEQRLQRTLKESLRQLQELQAKRLAKAKEEAEAKEKAEAEERAGAAPVEDEAEAQDQPRNQFVYSTSEIEAETRRQHIEPDAQNAEFPLLRAA
jgi:hypothetical protein